jgi:hypothetical protein
MKLSWQRVKHPMDERKEKPLSVIQRNRLVMCHHETLSYYFEITIIDDVGFGDGVAIGFTNEKFKKDKIPRWELNTYGSHSDDDKLYHNSDKIQ